MLEIGHVTRSVRPATCWNAQNATSQSNQCLRNEIVTRARHVRGKFAARKQKTRSRKSPTDRRDDALRPVRVDGAVLPLRSQVLHEEGLRQRTESAAQEWARSPREHDDERKSVHGDGREQRRWHGGGRLARSQRRARGDGVPFRRARREGAAGDHREVRKQGRLAAGVRLRAGDGRSPHVVGVLRVARWRRRAAAARRAGVQRGRAAERAHAHEGGRRDDARVPSALWHAQRESNSQSPDPARAARRAGDYGFASRCRHVPARLAGDAGCVDHTSNTGHSQPQPCAHPPAC